MKPILIWCLFLAVDIGFYYSTDTAWREHTKAYLIPGGGFVAYATAPRCSQGKSGSDK